MDKATRRLAAFKALAAHAHKLLELEFGLCLWDGSTIPENWPSDDLTVSIADEGAVAAMIRKPNAETLANLWAAKRIDIHNGTMFDLIDRRPKVRTRDLRKRLDKKLALTTAAKFLFVSRGGPWPLETVGKDRESDGSAGENKKNIGHHYDVSNRFYELWLDPRMVYTCAYFTDWNNSLQQAQHDKLEMTCRKLRLQPGEKVLDIGCGWGAFAIHAAQNYGVECVGVTLSEEQAAYAKAKVERLGLDDRVRIELLDYANVQETFDKVVSLGMFEHVGLANFGTYFNHVNRVLKPGGYYLHHAITRPGKSNAARTGKKRAEFAALTRYIFPGGELDYIGRTVTNLELSGFEVHDVEDWREHYQRTCRFWHDRLLANWDAAVREAGEVNARVWLAYLGACSISFQRNNVLLYQTLSSKRVRGPAGLPPTRADLYRSDVPAKAHQ